MGRKFTYKSTGGKTQLPDTLPKSVEDYLSGGAPEGQRNRTLFGVACQLRDIHRSQEETASILGNRAMADGLPEWEITDVLDKVFSRPPRELPTGAIKDDGQRVSPAPQQKSKQRYQLKRRARQHREDITAMDRATPVPVPVPVEDAFRTVLTTAFEEGEGVCIAGTREGQPERGAALTREEWLERLDRKGSIDKCFTGKEGLFLRLNPLKPRSKCLNDDVTDFRHVLVEFDNDMDGVPIPKDRQFGMFLASNLPITCVLDSGNKSLHAWVRVDATDAAQFEERARDAYAVFTGDGGALDEANLNPNRFSRCPEGWRTVKGEHVQQTMVHMGMGAASWDEWEAHREAAEFGAPLRFNELMAYDVENDPNTVIGNRWLCKGGSVVFVSQSGVGKSSLLVQLSHGWASNRPEMTFGIKATKPLRQLIVQAENDEGDVAEAVQGVANAFDLSQNAAELNANIEWRRISTSTGEDFLNRLEALVKLTRPDMVWIDPLMNFVGDDLKEQSVISKFCTEGLNPISMETGCIFALIHHTGKPMGADAKRGRTSSDRAYTGLGSSALTNWSREVVSIERIPAPEGHPATFSMVATKRRTRAGMRVWTGAEGTEGENEFGDATEEIFIRHANDGTIHWTQTERPPEEVRQGSEKAKGGSYTMGKKKPEAGPGRPSSFDAAAQLKLADFVATHAGGDVRMVTGQKLKALAALLGKSEPTTRDYLRQFGAARDEAEAQLSEGPF